METPSNQQSLFLIRNEPICLQRLSGDYWFEVGSLLEVPPGNSVLFSLPTDHLSTKWHVEIPFDFKVPTGKGPRPDDIGGFPVQFLEYSLWDLPEEVKVQIQEKK